MCHGGAFAARLLPMLAVGATGVMTRTFDLLAWIEALRVYPVTIFVNRPTLLQALLEHPLFKDSYFAALET